MQPEACGEKACKLEALEEKYEIWRGEGLELVFEERGRGGRRLLLEDHVFDGSFAAGRECSVNPCGWSLLLASCRCWTCWFCCCLLVLRGACILLLLDVLVVVLLAGACWCLLVLAFCCCWTSCFCSACFCIAAACLQCALHACNAAATCLQCCTCYLMLQQRACSAAAAT